MGILNFFRKNQSRKDWTTIKALGLPNGILNSLMNEDIYSICELQEAWKEGKLKKIYGFGAGKMRVIADLLAAYEEDPEYFKLKNL